MENFNDWAKTEILRLEKIIKDLENKKRIVIIEVLGGVATVAETPDDVVVDIIDYDN